ncbi:MAG: cytidylate kinase-like family protein [Nitrospirae bacterium]|nr:cytidylate kinase-like family protein [Nitrospirota bacterium]
MKSIDGAGHDLLHANVEGQAVQIMQDELRRMKKEVARHRFFVTIAREFGCQGTELAISLADALNKRVNPPGEERWMFYDKDLLGKISEDNHLRREIIAAAEEHSRGVVEQFLGKVLIDKPDDYEIFQYLVSALTTLANRGNVVLVGRGAGIVTQNMPHGIHIRLYAGEEFRIKHVKECRPDLENAGHDEVRAFIKHESKKRDTFVERFTVSSAADPHIYHLMLNNEKFTIPEMVEVIICFLRAKGMKI